MNTPNKPPPTTAPKAQSFYLRPRMHKNLLGYDKFTFFYRSADPFSNWYPAPFTFMGIRFATSEQFMMFAKAMLFGDADTAQEVMGSSDPRDNKAAGRAVRGFIPVEWDLHARDIVYAGCWAKFTSTEEMLRKLTETEGTLLVEASPTDLIWGIGRDASDPKALDPAKWRGTNWLGEVLTKLRDDLMSGRVVATPKIITDMFNTSDEGTST